MTMRTPLLLALAAGITLLTGCSNLGQVQAWEKGQLAKPAMTFEADPLDQRFMQHIYGSKEAASGGYGVGGGGCGCN
jgi:Domain of unknown function (DUF4266)